MSVYFEAGIREIEKRAEMGGFSPIRMMENAGSAAAGVILENFKLKGKRVTVVAGCGNNGGDGFVVARKLFDAGADVSIILAAGMPKTESAKESLSRLSAYSLRIYNSSDVEVHSLLRDSYMLIDAIFGIGFHGEVGEDIADIITWFNLSKAVKVSLDLPSGCECNTAVVSNACIKADVTITFIAFKPCHVLFPASDYCGRLIKVDIGISGAIMDEVYSNISIINNEYVKNSIPRRNKNYHKGNCGTVVQICGSYGMAGAALLSGKAALRTGAGLVKAVLPKSIYPIVATELHEAVYIPYEETDEGAINVKSTDKIQDAINSADSLLIGCGLSQEKIAQELLFNSLSTVKVPTVIDADGINIISKNIDVLKESEAPIILTPHPAEMARLIRSSVAEVQHNRFKVAHAFSMRFNKIVVLKGANTIVALPDGRLYVCMAGNPGMAVGGSGDVLAGIIGSLLAQGMSPSDAAICGVQIHARAGDLAAENKSIHAMLPGDIIDCLPSLFKEYES